MKTVRVFTLLLTMATGLVFAEEQATTPEAASQTDHHKLVQRLSADSDETVNSSSIKLKDTYVDKADDSWNNTTELDLSYAFGRTDSGSWGVTLGLPYVYYDPGTKKNKYQADGLGDISLKLNRSFNTTKKLRLSAALQSTFNTAADPELGGGATILDLIGNSSYHFNKTFRGQFKVKYAGSLETDPGVDDTSQVTLTPALATLFPYHILCTVSYIGKINLETDDYSDNAKIQLSHLFGKHKQWSADVYYKVPLETGNINYTLEASATYHF
jgi:hypothetical protein